MTSSLSSSLSSRSITNWRLTLEVEGYAKGLIHQIERVIMETPLRIWVLDNSASMNLLDGYRYLLDFQGSSKVLRTVKCTRWQALLETVRYQVHLAALTRAPTIFRLLNSCPNIASEYAIAQQPIYDVDDMERQIMTISNSFSSIQPTGATPLTLHIYGIRNMVLPIQQSLKSRNQYVTLIIATDGLPSDEKGCSSTYEGQLFIQALRMLETLSISLIIHLCTQEEKVKQFYYNLCPQLKLSIHIVEDFMSEATKIHKYNPWVTYSLPLHRIQEFGVMHTSWDNLKRHSLTPMEIKGYCALLYGCEATTTTTSTVDANLDHSRFLKLIKTLTKKDRYQHWDPCRQKLAYILDIKLLAEALGHEDTCCSIS